MEKKANNKNYEIPNLKLSGINNQSINMKERNFAQTTMGNYEIQSNSKNKNY
jgi:hypothetical protein